MAYSLFDNKENCCGCTACQYICPKRAITMEQDIEGFLYPSINNDLCVSCGLCRKVCAFQNDVSLEQSPIVYAAKAADEIRIESTSGGVFTVLSDVILKNKGIIYGSAFNEDLKAVHIRADNESERNRCRGSKYSQSDLNSVFYDVKRDLKNGLTVMFTGTTCQCAALREFTKDLSSKNLYTVDIVCHGTPSPKLFKEYLSYIEKKRGKKIAAYYHRPKKHGWAHEEQIVYIDGKTEDKTTLSSAWKTIFYSNLALRPSCYNCQYTKTNRPSDITIADFWGIEEYAPKFADKKGISLILVNSSKGMQLFNDCKKTLQILEMDIDQAVSKNPNLKTPSKPFGNRNVFWEFYYKNGIDAVIKTYGNDNIKQKVKYVIRNLIGALGLLKIAKKLLKK